MAVIGYMAKTFTKAQILGQSEDHLIFVPEFECLVHSRVVEPLQKLSALAEKSGFSLAIASSFRSFDRQKEIWNAKASGCRAVLDNDEQAIDIASLDEWDLVQSILRWSALPGASRHHWGTDFDIYDKSSIPSDYVLQLTATETEEGGPFFEFHQWLTKQIKTENSCDFVRPYDRDKGGIGCEPWHISYKPVATQFEQSLSVELLYRAITEAKLTLGDTVLNNLPEIHSRYITANLA